MMRRASSMSKPGKGKASRQSANSPRQMNLWDPLPAGGTRGPARKRPTKRDSKSRWGLYPAQELAQRGAEVRYCAGPLDLDERETSISFLEGERTAEIHTTSAQWMRKIESLGHMPYFVEVYDDCEARIYKVPKSIISIPTAKRRARMRRR